LRTRSSQGLLRLLVAGLGVILALAVLEAGLRIARPNSVRLNALLYSSTVRTSFDDIQTTPELLATSTFGYHPLGHTPGFVLNSRGFRTDEYDEVKEPGVFRVVVLGDSFTFDSYGVPIQQMWHQVLERELAARSGRTVEVLSLSAHGVGPRFELRLWELEGRRLDPDLVVLAFFVGNDFTDEAGTPIEGDPGGGLARWSLSYRLLRNRLRLRHVQDSSAEGAGAVAAEPEARGGFERPSYAATYDPDVPTFDERTFERIERDRLLVFAGPDQARFDQLFHDAAAVIERLARDVERTSAPFVMLVIPDQAQTDPALLERLLPTLPIPAGALDIDRPQRWLATYFGERGIPYLDLLPRFREAPAEPPLYKLRDTHWSASGNRLAGEALADHLLGRARGPAARR
jgi:hypothetical protein